MCQIFTPLQVATTLHATVTFCFLILSGFIFQPVIAQSLDLDDFESELIVSRIPGVGMDSLIFQLDIRWDEAPGFDLSWVEVDLNLLEPLSSGANPAFLDGLSLGSNPSRDFTGKVTLPNSSTFRINIEPTYGPALIGGGLRMTAALLVPKSYPSGTTYLTSMGGIIMVENMDFKRPEEELNPSLDVQAWPNPFVNDLQLKWGEFAKARVLIMDHVGKVCYDSRGLVSLNASLDLELLPSGGYILQLIRESGETQTLRVRKD